MLPIPDVALAGPIIGYVFVPELEGHLPNKSKYVSRCPGCLRAKIIYK
jgi:hypothetical protein